MVDWDGRVERIVIERLLYHEDWRVGWEVSLVIGRDFESRWSGTFLSPKPQLVA